MDFIYRNLDFVEKAINNCFKVKIVSDYCQEPPSGFHSYIYCSEIEADKVLFDSEIYIEKIGNLIEEFKALSHKIYTPKYTK